MLNSLVKFWILYHMKKHSCFYPTALKGCLGIVFTHVVWMGGRTFGRDGGREKVCPGCRKLILGSDIAYGV